MSAIGHNGALTFSSDNGWVAIARSIRSHPLVGIHLFAKPMDASRGAVQPMAAFIDLIMECRYEDGFIQNGGRKMEVKRGQMVGAVSWLAARWNWTPMAVRIWLDKLEADMMISRFVPGASKSNKHVGRTATVISLCNYEQFQSFGENKQQTQQQTNSNQTTNEQQQYIDNKETKEQGNKKTKEDNRPAGIVVAQANAGGASLPEIGSLNGATSQIVDDLARWLNPYSPDLTMAHKQVAEAVRAYGDRAVLDGYMELKADHADGKVRALNVKAFYGFVRTARERQNRFAPKKPKLSRWAT
jgi:hypothetical protein